MGIRIHLLIFLLSLSFGALPRVWACEDLFAQSSLRPFSRVFIENIPAPENGNATETFLSQVFKQVEGFYGWVSKDWLAEIADTFGISKSAIQIAYSRLPVKEAPPKHVEVEICTWNCLKGTGDARVAEQLISHLEKAGVKAGVPSRGVLLSPKECLGNCGNPANFLISGVFFSGTEKVEPISYKKLLTMSPDDAVQFLANWHEYYRKWYQESQSN